MPQVEARIVVGALKEGKHEIKVVDPHTGRESATGLTCNPGEDLDSTIRCLKTTLERSGSRVTIKFM